jgi:hypothetical protein
MEVHVYCDKQHACSSSIPRAKTASKERATTTYQQTGSHRNCSPSEHIGGAWQSSWLAPAWVTIIGLLSMSSIFFYSSAYNCKIC